MGGCGLYIKVTEWSLISSPRASLKVDIYHPGRWVIWWGRDRSDWVARVQWTAHESSWCIASKTWGSWLWPRWLNDLIALWRNLASFVLNAAYNIRSRIWKHLNQYLFGRGKIDLYSILDRGHFGMFYWMFWSLFSTCWKSNEQELTKEPVHHLGRENRCAKSTKAEGALHQQDDLCLSLSKHRLNIS